MPTRDEIYEAIRVADAAGRADDVQRLGDYLRTLPSDAPKPAAPSPRPGYGASASGIEASAPEVTSTSGALGRALPRGVVPAVGGLAGFTAGATAAGALASPLEAVPGYGTAVHAAIIAGGGLLGALGIGYGAHVAQEKVLDTLPTTITAPIGQDAATRAKDRAEHPYATMIGEAAPGFLFGRPSFSPARLPSVATPMQRVFASPLAQTAVGATIGGGVEAGNELATEGKIDPVKLGIATVMGASQTRNTRLGEAVSNIGARAGNYAAGLFGARRAQFDSMAGDFEQRHGPDAGNQFAAPSEPPPNPPSGGWAHVATPEGEILSSDGNAPVAFRNHKQAARFAVDNELGGGYDIAIINGQLVLKRRDINAATEPASAAPAPAEEAAAPAPAPVVPAVEPVVRAPDPAAPAATPVAVQAGIEAVAPKPVAPPEAPPAQPGEGEVTTPAGNKVRTRFEVVDASRLRQAEGELQNRDRSRASTDLQIQDIVSKFDPTRLGESAESDRGAPIVGPDDIIESGNGRTMALNKIYDAYPEQAAAYRSFIEGMGHDTTGMERPVLIRRRLTEMTPEERRAFVIDSNRDTKLAMGASERAKTDAAGLTPDTMALYKGGDVAHAANDEFVRSFLSRIPTQEQAAFLASDGKLSSEGIRRIKTAIKAAAFDDADLLGTLDESQDNNIKSIGNAMEDVAPAWVGLRQAIASGEVLPQFDVTPQVAEAAKILRDLRLKGESLKDWMAQEDMLNPHDPIVTGLLKLYHNAKLTRSASREAIRSALETYVKQARAQLVEPGFFPNEGPGNPADLINQILGARGDEKQGSLIEDKLYDTDGKERRDEGGNQGPAREARSEGEVREGRERSDGRAGEEGGSGEVEDRSGIQGDGKGKYGDKFLEASFTNRPSIYEGAIRAIGMDPAKFMNLTPERKLALLRKALTDLTGVEVEVDNTLNIQLAIDQLLDAHQTLQGMAYALGITPRALSLDGGLKLKLLKKGNFLGVFFPEKNAIGLPGRSNSFAHEWSHALDYHIMKKLGITEGRGLSGAVRKDGADFDPPSLRGAFVDLMNAMFFDKADMAARIMKLEEKIAATKSAKQKAAHQAQIDNYRAGKSQTQDARTDFYKNAKSIDAASGKEYWTSPTEMMARAMEAYVSRMAETAGFGTEFIGKGDSNYLSNAEERFAKTFPKEEERNRIFEAIGNLMIQLHNEAVLEGHTGEAPVMGDISKITDFDKLVSMIENGSLMQREMAAWRRAARQKARMLEGRAMDPKNTGQRIMDNWAMMFFSMSGQMKMLERRWKSAAINEIHDKLAFIPGAGKYTGQTFHESAVQWTRKNLNRVANILKANDLTDMDADTERMLRDALIAEDTGAIPANVIKAAAGIRKVLDEEFYRNQNAGIDLGYARGVGYLKRVLDLPRVMANREGFVNDAGEVYKLVFDKEFGGDVDEVLSKEDGLKKFLRLANQQAKAGADIPGMDEIKKLNKQISKLESAQKTSDDPDQIAGELAELYEQQAELLGEMFDAVRDNWARTRAEAWLGRITSAAEYDFDAHSPDNTYTKSRELPPEADKLLERFYVQNPIEAVQTYISQSARRIAYAERFGPKGEKLKTLVERMGAEGVPIEDQLEVLKIVNIATGRVRADISRSGRWFLSFVQMYGTMRLLPRAVLSSLTEPITASITTGDFREGFRSLAASIKGMKALNGKQRAELAQAIGIVTDGAADTIMEERFGGLFGDATRFDKITQKMFQNTGLTALTRNQRQQVVASSHAFLMNLAPKVLDGDANAISMMHELGIADPAVFAKEMVAKGRMPTTEELASEWGHDYGLATARFVNLTIQEPDAMMRPQLANNPAGRVVYGITSFSSSFWRNIIKRQGLLAAGAYKRAGGGAKGAAAAAGHLGAKFLPSALMLFGMQAIVSTLREYLLNPTRWDEWEKEGTLEQNLAQLAFFRSFSFGVADPFISAYSGLKYQRDLSNVFVGPAPGVFLQDAQNIISPTLRDSDKTNVAEYNRDRAIYNMLVGPSVSIGLSMLPTGPLLSPAAGLGQAVVTSPATGNAFATMTQGPKGTKTGEQDVRAERSSERSGKRTNNRRASH